MYEKNLPRKGFLKLEFEDGVTIFLETRMCQVSTFKYGRWIERHMMVFDIVGQAFWISSYNQEGVPDYGTRKTILIWITASFVEKLGTSQPGSELQCKKTPYAILSGDPGPSNPKHVIALYLELLIEELQNLWHVVVLMHDNATNQAFMMRAALMWTISYGMASRWSTVGVMGCPVCMDDTWTFHLQPGRKTCYFDCHREFLPQNLPYCRNKKAFTENRVERKVARLRLTREWSRDWVAEFNPAVEVPLTLPPG
ncbi:UNVERIFIED_CONTAM: hypothetical protein Slati_0946500 [Sesamum latifolium]|uniref:Uncharacterized protein n=1 Tax=Sesamum latifolium TaxID=2727402 RepID=A0AAW2XPJ6_9LAMI